MNSAPDHERIWLQNPDDANETEGRMWCQDKFWPNDEEDGEPTEYIRADLYATSQEEIARLRKALEPFSIAAGYLSDANGWSDTDEIELCYYDDGIRISVIQLSAFRAAARALAPSIQDDGGER